MNKTNLQKEANGDSAPFFGSWPKAYCAALGLFAVEILLFYVFTVMFS